MSSAGLLLVGLLCLSAGMVSSGNPKPQCPSGGKPGFCPRPTAEGPCIEDCSSDYSCPGNLKCCKNRCGHICQNPILQVKPGDCPKFKLRPGLPCKLECCQDSDCKDTQKCCQQGCSKVCFLPALPA